MQVVVFLGPPGSGKGTQTRLLVRTWQVPLVSMGDLLRKEIEKKSPMGTKLSAAMDRGEFPPWEFVRDIFYAHLNTLSHSLVIFDGIPRNSAQIEDVEAILSRKGGKIAKAIFLDVPSSVLITRVKERYQCSKCGATYTQTAPPITQGICDVCQSMDFTRRKDDQEEILQRRLAIYGETVNPLLEHFHRQGVLMKIDGTLSIQEIQSKVVDHLMTILPVLGEKTSSNLLEI